MHLLRLAFGDGARDFYVFHWPSSPRPSRWSACRSCSRARRWPLLFHHLREQAGDLGALAGRIYSWNTIGSLLGALLGGYALLSWLDPPSRVPDRRGGTPRRRRADDDRDRGTLREACRGDRAGRGVRPVRAAAVVAAPALRGPVSRARADAHTHDGPRAAEARGFLRNRW
jgi:hypothetical protein